MAKIRADFIGNRMSKELGADNMAAVIGSNLKNIRLTRNYSLDDVSALCSVSRSMLSEIERGTKSPTIAVLYKICKGIHISFNALLKIPATNVEIVRGDALERHGNIDLQVLYPYDLQNSMEVQKIYIAPHTRHEADSHGSGIWEYVLVMDGSFSLILGEEQYSLQSGESLRFLADRHHVYCNESDRDLWLFNLILYDN